MFGWLKKKKPTVNEIIAASFYEPGRWHTDDDGWHYTDNKTGAVLQRMKSNGIWINGVQQSTEVKNAFYEWLRVPYLFIEAEKKAALEKLYANNP